MSLTRRTLVAWIATFAVLPQVALAIDGVRELNHTCATQTGCFPGDTAGYPVTIGGSAGRSYVLTSNLVIPDVDTTAVVIRANDVSLDLNHFAIVRAACVGTTTACTQAGSGFGVRSDGNTHGIAVRNGSVTGMGATGVLLQGQGQSHIEGLRLRWNGGDGIFSRGRATILRNLAYENGDDGIFADLASTVSRNTTVRNGGDGIRATLGSVIANNTAFDNGGHGISGGFGATISGNVLRANGGNGIVTGNGGLVQSNTVFFNDGWGLLLSSSTGYRENLVWRILSVSPGTVSGGVNLGANSCQGGASCP